MSVVQATIKADLEALFALAKTAPMSDSDYADAEATIIADAIVSADVATTVSTTVITPDTINGTGTGTGSGGLS